MKHDRIFLAIVAVPLGFGPADVRADATVAQQIVARRAVELLPPDIAAIFRDHAAELEERCLEPDVLWTRDPDKRDRARWHYIMLDIEAKAATKEARLEAASRLPHDDIAARRLYTRLKRPDAGRLPWIIEDSFKQLVDAFEDGEASKIIECAGHLMHFALDAALPFNATRDSDGLEAGNLSLGRLRPGERHYENQNARQRVFDELIRRNREHYEQHILLTADDTDGISNPRERSFTVLTEALGTLDEVLTADREILSALNVIDESSFGEMQEKYYDQLNERCGDLCVERLRAAALFGGKLVAGAWSVAGKPNAEKIRARGSNGKTVAAAPAKGGKPATNGAAPASSGVVGSRNSNVYHRPDCEWAQKIAPGNLVKYNSAKEAAADGRKPCGKCKPG
ncbi:MAG TPA: hypothetical protein VGM03_13800 [Phycisphaerae bacterium]|jgi:hypothetical protein